MSSATCQTSNSISTGPGKPALKIKITPPSTLGVPPGDLDALVGEAIRARPSPRRNQPDFYFCDTVAQPVAPPPTPSDDSHLTPSSTAASTPASEKKVRFSFDSVREPTDGPLVENPEKEEEEGSEAMKQRDKMIERKLRSTLR